VATNLETNTMELYSIVYRKEWLFGEFWAQIPVERTSCNHYKDTIGRHTLMIICMVSESFAAFGTEGQGGSRQGISHCMKSIAADALTCILAKLMFITKVQQEGDEFLLNLLPYRRRQISAHGLKQAFTLWSRYRTSRFKFVLWASSIIMLAYH
jgi:hypothetical protein